MVVVSGPATLVAWLVVGLLTLNLVKQEPVQLLFHHPSSTSSTTVPRGGGASAPSTTSPVLVSTTFLRKPAQVDVTVSLDGSVQGSYFAASVAQGCGWLAAGLIGVAVGRVSKRRVPAPEAAPRPPFRAPSPAKAGVISVTPPPAPQAGLGGVVTPSTRRSRDGGKVI